MPVSDLPIRFQPEPGHTMVRLGRDRDGGYVVPALAVMASRYLLSFGLSLDWTFESDFERKQSPLRIHCYDHTLHRRALAASAAGAALKAMMGSVPRKRLRRMRPALEYVRFFGKRHVRHVQSRICGKNGHGSSSFDAALDLLTSGGGVFLKCDIEGAEYEIISQIASSSSRLCGIAIEFHDAALYPERFHTALDTLAKHFRIVHVHANNCAPIGVNGLADALEVSLISRALDREDRRGASGYPHAWNVSDDAASLDAPNTDTVADIQLRYT